MLVAVYDPSAGFVTGGGWIDSPANADKRQGNENLTGKATFGFVSKYKKGATVPTGQTEFQFKAGDLNFHSSEYQWLVVTQGGTNAQFKDSGTVNGEGPYNFMIWASDDDTDTFRIMIAGVYDNGTGGTDQEIGGGNIVVHTSKK
ncbi:hypothetical protein ACFLTP_06530 [Chloroflexota bacterium]